jgi:hypothetical protein
VTVMVLFYTHQNRLSSGVHTGDVQTSRGQQCCRRPGVLSLASDFTGFSVTGLASSAFTFVTSVGSREPICSASVNHADQ